MEPKLEVWEPVDEMISKVLSSPENFGLYRIQNIPFVKPLIK